MLWSDDFRRQSTKDSSYASRKVSKSASTSQQPPFSHASRDQSVPKQPRSSLQNSGDVQNHPSAIAMSPIAASGESPRNHLGIIWDSRSASSQIGLTDIVSQSPVVVDTRRRELEGY